MDHNDAGTPPADATAIESYRRLIELQKEIIRLAKQNARASQKCAELRDRVAEDVLGPTKAAGESRPADQSLPQLPTNVINSNLM